MKNQTENDEGLGQEAVVEETSIAHITQRTKNSILEAFYRDESILNRVLFILAGKKTNFSDLVTNIEQGRSEFKKLDMKDRDVEYQNGAKAL